MTTLYELTQQCPEHTRHVRSEEFTGYPVQNYRYWVVPISVYDYWYGQPVAEKLDFIESEDARWIGIPLSFITQEGWDI